MSLLFRTAGLILAGGASSRMGRAKAWVPLRGRSLALWQRDWLAGEGCSPVWLNPPPGEQPAGWDLVRDIPGEAGGPLAGILAGLERAAAASIPRLLSVPVDQPDLPPGLVERLQPKLRDAAFAHVVAGGEPHPLLALWEVGPALPLVRAAFAAGEGGVRDLAQRSRAAHLVLPMRLSNLNRPDDLPQARA